MLEVYVWSWMHLHPAHVRRVLTRLLLISILVLLPLLALNLSLIKRGHTPKTPSFNISESQQR